MTKSFPKSFVFKSFPFTLIRKAGVSKLLKYLRFLGELAWTVDLIVEIKLHFQISSV